MLHNSPDHVYKLNKLIFFTQFTGFKFLYHRLDLIKPNEPCIHFSRYAAKGQYIVNNVNIITVIISKCSSKDDVGNLGKG